MPAQTRTNVLYLALSAAVLAATAWLLPVDTAWNDTAGVLLILTAMMLGTIWYVSTPTAAQSAPDVLGEQFGPQACFEGDGVTLVTRFEVRDGVFWLDVYYQNRFTGRCHAEVSVVPMEGWSANGPVEVPPIVATIDCAGGEVGVVSHASFVAAVWQARVMIYDIYAATQFPDGQGEMLRSEVGPRIGGARTEDAVATGALLMLGHVRIRGPRAGKIELTLPQGVAQTAAEIPARRHERLWEMPAATSK